MTTLNTMKNIISVNRIAHKTYEILYEDDTKSVVHPQDLPKIQQVLKKSPVLYSDLGPDCDICERSMRQFYRYRWCLKINPTTGRVLRYDRKKFTEEILLNSCIPCNINKYSWEDGTELICEDSLKNSTLGKAVRLQHVSEDPNSCPGKRQFAMGYRHGEFTCTHRGVCREAGCAPSWVFFINESSIVLMDDIIEGVVNVYGYLDVPFLEHVQC